MCLQIYSLLGHQTSGCLAHDNFQLAQAYDHVASKIFGRAVSKFLVNNQFNFSGIYFIQLGTRLVEIAKIRMLIVTKGPTRDVQSYTIQFWGRRLSHESRSIRAIEIEVVFSFYFYHYPAVQHKIEPCVCLF
jgi:hypothetical protein